MKKNFNPICVNSAHARTTLAFREVKTCDMHQRLTPGYFIVGLSVDVEFNM